MRILLVLCVLITQLAFAESKIKFGEKVDMSKVMPISKMLASAQKYTKESVTVKGIITSVCAKRGCWMKLASDKRFQNLRIKVRDGDMVFPLNSKGRTAYATGTLKGMKLNKKQTVNYLSHMAKESGEKFDAASVKEGMVLYQFSPSGVEIK